MVVSYSQERYELEQIIPMLEPELGRWLGRFKSLTPPQKYSIVSIMQGKSTLIAAPTGSGKTLAVFLSIINTLLKMGKEGKLEDKVYCIYISPLKALDYDIEKNLNQPLEAIYRYAEKENSYIPQIRVGVRTGDTSQAERVKMLKKPPHILVTTPESVAILLVAPKFRENLKSVKWVIVDEIHEICNNKRGVHLSLSLERLQALALDKIVRIGLSATIHPIEEVARYLVGYNKDGTERDCTVVDTRFVKPIELKVLCPVKDLVHTNASKASYKMYKLITDLISLHKTTLIFTNTRSGTERVVYQLSKLKVVDGDELAAHHGSLSKELRRDIEDRLKHGLMRAVVTSTSLELGIDVGSIEGVVQIGSPKSVSKCLQRVGRSGHSLKKVSKGYLIPLERDDLMEDAVIVSEAKKGSLDRVHIPKNCLDVLSQHVVGMAIERRWGEEAAYELVKSSYNYRDLPYSVFKSVLKYLSGGYEQLEGHRVYGKIWYDDVEKVFGRRGILIRVIYSTNIGTIPENVHVKVLTLNNRWVGMIEEEFLERLRPGDVFLLGGKPYEFKYSKGLTAYVTPAEGEKPTVPTWFSEMLPLSFDTAESIGRFREKVFSMLDLKVPKKQILETISKETSSDSYASESIYSYFKTQIDFLNYLRVKERHSDKVIMVENYVGERREQNFIFHTVFGRRVNEALSRIYAYVITKYAKRNVSVTITDSGFILTIPRHIPLDIRKIVNIVSKENARHLLIEAIKNTELLRRRFRHCASRALMVLRNYKGHEITVNRQQSNAQLLMQIVEEFEDFPVLQEAYREIIEDLMDVENALRIIDDVELGRRRFIFLPQCDLPSPFSHDMLLSGYSDMVLMEDKKALLKALYDEVVSRVKEQQKKNLAKE
ncbi:MAG: ATP-dependent helicase [Nitrososphaeria archaeon]